MHNRLGWCNVSLALIRLPGPLSRNPRQSWILDSKPRIPDSSYWIPVSLSVELGFRITITSGIKIFSKALDSGLHKQRFPGPSCSKLG